MFDKNKNRASNSRQYTKNANASAQSFSGSAQSPAADDVNTIEGRNPVLELIRSDRDVDKLYVSKDAVGSAGKITALARKKGIPVSFCDRRKLDALSQGLRHQGVIAVCPAHSYSEIDDVFALAESRNEMPLIIICDGITDPHNIGAIIRSAEAAGAHGVIIPKHRSAGINAVCAKTAAGAVEYIPIVREANLNSAISALKSRGVWIAGAEAGSDKNVFNTDFNAPLAIVIGSEGEGISRLVKQNCDFLVSIPLKGRVNSLNASAAAAVLLFEVLRSRSGTEN